MSTSLDQLLGTAHTETSKKLLKSATASEHAFGVLKKHLRNVPNLIVKHKFNSGLSDHLITLGKHLNKASVSKGRTMDKHLDAAVDELENFTPKKVSLTKDTRYAKHAITQLKTAHAYSKYAQKQVGNTPHPLEFGAMSAQFNDIGAHLNIANHLASGNKRGAYRAVSGLGRTRSIKPSVAEFLDLD